MSKYQILCYFLILKQICKIILSAEEKNEALDLWEYLKQKESPQLYSSDENKMVTIEELVKGKEPITIDKSFLDRQHDMKTGLIN